MRETQAFRFIDRRAITALTLSVLAAACSSGGGGGSAAVIDEDETPANDTPATANAIPLGTPVHGDVTTIGDVDYFQFTFAQGQIIQIELLAAREDQDTWDTEDNVARTTLFDTDGTSMLLDHVLNDPNGWSWGKHDLDMPCFYVPATGTYYVAVAQDDPAVAGGDYTLHVHTTSLANLQQETEASGATGANDTDGTAEPITPGTVHGFHVDDELDYYSFTVSAPSIVRFEMTAYRNGMCQGDTEYYDPLLALYDVDGTTELWSDDDTFFYDSAIQYHIDTPGTYFVAVDEYSLNGGDGEYFLSFTRSAANAVAEGASNDTFGTADAASYGARYSGTIDAGDFDFFAFSGTAGDMVRLQIFDVDNSETGVDDVIGAFFDTDGTTQLQNGGDGDLQTLTTILTTTGTFFVRIEPGSGLTPYMFELTRFRNSTFETEANDTIATADILTNRVAGVIDAAAAVDVFRFSGAPGQLVRIDCFASNDTTESLSSDGYSEYSGHGSDLEPVLEILDSLGNVIATATSTPTNVFTEDVVDALPTVQIGGVIDTAGIYYVRVSDANGNGGSTFSYVLEKH